MSPPDDSYLTPNTKPIAGKGNSEQEDIASQIKRLIDSQPFAVLCTQGEGKPYGSLVAYATEDNLRQVIFVTPKATKKFRLLVECENVALLIDNRSDYPADLTKIEAVTASGRAMLIEGGQEFEHDSSILIERHPFLATFARSDSYGLFRIDIQHYLHVCRFQEVNQWDPASVL